MTQGAPPDADVRVTADPATFFALADGRVTPARAVREGHLAVTGEPAAARPAPDGLPPARARRRLSAARNA